MPGGRPHGEVGQIRQIAYAPRPLRAHAVELGGQAPCAARPRAGGQPSDAGETMTSVLVSDDRPERAVGGSRAAGRRAARRSPRRSAGRRDRKGACCSRADAGRCARCRPPAGSTARRVAVGDVDPERRRGAGPADDRRRQGTCPVVAVVAASAAMRSSSVAAGTPSASSTATSVDSATPECLPVQSSYSVATP